MSDATALSRTGKPARARSLSCPNCGAAVMVRASGSSVTAACGSCGAVLDVANDDVRLIAQAQARVKAPLIAIGTRGVLEGTEWEVVGWQERSSEEGSWRWEEFLLWNPYQGFRFLGEDHGNWTLYTVLRRAVSEDGRIAGDPTKFRATEVVTARTEYVLGEFYWRVKVGDEVAVREFVAPPASLSQERNGTEVTWSYGTFVSPETVQAAFKLESVPVRTEAAADAPVAPGRRTSRMWMVAGVAALLLVAEQVVPFGVARNRVVLQQSFTAVQADKGRAVASAPFDVPGSGGNLVVEVSMVHNNDPLTVELAVVSVAGDRRFDGAVELSNPFDEASAARRVRFASVPGGTYKLLVTPSSSAFGTAAAPDLPPTTEAYLNQALRGPAPVPVNRARFEYSATVRRHTPVMDYFWVSLVALLTWPVVVSVWRYWRGQQGGGDPGSSASESMSFLGVSSSGSSDATDTGSTSSSSESSTSGRFPSGSSSASSPSSDTSSSSDSSSSSSSSDC